MKCRWSALLVISLISFLLTGLVVQAERGNVIKNGGFEEEFPNGVATHWGSFQNGGLADSNFHDDDWAPVVYEGEHSQLIGADRR